LEDDMESLEGPGRVRFQIALRRREAWEAVKRKAEKEKPSFHDKYAGKPDWEACGWQPEDVPWEKMK
jgi:hypothetical protein